MARAAKKAPARRASSLNPQITAAVTPEFKQAVDSYAARNGLNVSQVLVSAVSAVIGGRIKDGMARRQRRRA